MRAFGGAKHRAVAQADAAVPFLMILGARPEQTSSSLAWSVIEDDFRFSFDLDDVDGTRLPGVEVGLAASEDVVDIDLLLHLRVTGDDPALTATFGPLEPHAP